MKIQINNDNWDSMVVEHTLWDHTYRLTNGTTISGYAIEVTRRPEPGCLDYFFAINFEDEQDAIFFLLSYGGEVI